MPKFILPDIALPLVDRSGFIDERWYRALEQLQNLVETLATVSGLNAQVLALQASINQLTSVVLNLQARVADAVGIRATFVSANFTTSPDFNTYFVDTSGGAVTATLNATPLSGDGRDMVDIWDVSGDAGTNPISLNGGGNNIAGVASVANFIQIGYGHTKLVWDDSQWVAA